MTERDDYFQRERRNDIIEEIHDEERTSSIIRETIYVQDEESSQYFTNKLLEIINEQYLVGGRVRGSFIKLLIEESLTDESPALGYLKQWLDKKEACDGTKIEKFTEQLQELVLCVLLHCVETDNMAGLRLFLTWSAGITNTFREDNAPIWHRLDIDRKMSEKMKNVEAMIRACEKNNYEMVAMFLNYNYEIDLNTECKINEEEEKFPLLLRSFKTYNPEIDVLRGFRIFRATTKPAYMIARFRSKYENVLATDPEQDYIWTDDNESANNEKLKNFFQKDFKDFDPILLSFENACEARKKGIFYVENQSKYDEVIEENFRFSTQILDLCKNQKEAKFLLEGVADLDHRDGLNSSQMRLLETAIKSGNVNFVSHDFSQQLLRDFMVTSEALTQDGSKLKIGWNSNRRIGRFIYFLTCFLLMPVFVTIQTTVDLIRWRATGKTSLSHWFYNFFSFPMNRLLSYLSSTVVFLLLIVLQTVEYHKIDKWTVRLGVIILAIAYMFDDFIQMKRKQIFHRFYFFSIFLNCCILIGSSIWIFDMLDNYECEQTDLWNQTNGIMEFNTTCRCPNRTKNQGEEYPMYCQMEACFTGLGITLFVFKSFYWYQLHPRMGPLAISVNKIMPDLLMIILVYSVFFIAFTSGIGMIMNDQGKQEAADALKNQTDCNDEFNAFRDWWAHENTTHKFDGVYKTSFWILFDPGKPDYLGENSEGHTKIPRYAGLCLWATFQVLVIIVLMNICIGLLNNTIARITKEKEKVWKFARTKVWLRFITDRSMPPPFNLISYLTGVLGIGCNRWRDTNGEPVMEMTCENPEAIYIKLVSRLTKRYLRRDEDSSCKVANKDHLDNFKMEVVKALRG